MKIDLYSKKVMIPLLQLILMLIPLFFHVSAPVSCLEQEIVLGKSDNWKDFISFSQIMKKEGKWGTLDLFLTDAEYTVTETTDLLAHFNTENSGDVSGNYTFTGTKPVIMKKESIFGGGCALFEKGKNQVSFKPSGTSLFYPGKLWGDFTMQFWLDPANLTDSEEIFSWSGSHLQGKKIVNQSVQCIISRRVCKWVFRNFFLPESGAPAGGLPGIPAVQETELKGITPLLPRKWHHHMVRFQAETGLLEYLVDGIPESVVYVNDPENTSTVLLPFIGTVSSSDIVLGRYFSGLMDEFSLTAEYAEEPVLVRYQDETGTGLSRVFDMKYTGSLVKKINAVYDKPQATDIYFYYRTADLPFPTGIPVPWTQFTPGSELNNAARGRYIQIRVELLPDGTGMVSPSLSSISIVYEPDLPPAQPVDVVAIAGDGKVTLYWKKVNQADVAGYEIYYGNRPGIYNGTGSLQGDSPVNAGNVTKFELTNLQNGKIYYFTVVTYDAAGTPHRSVFSAEVTARPNKLSGTETAQ